MLGKPKPITSMTSRELWGDPGDTREEFWDEYGDERCCYNCAHFEALFPGEDDTQGLCDIKLDPNTDISISDFVRKARYAAVKPDMGHACLYYENAGAVE